VAEHPSGPHELLAAQRGRSQGARVVSLTDIRIGGTQIRALGIPGVARGAAHHGLVPLGHA